MIALMKESDMDLPDDLLDAIIDKVCYHLIISFPNQLVFHLLTPDVILLPDICRCRYGHGR